MGELELQHAVVAVTRAAAPCDSCRFREPCTADDLACERYSMLVHGEGEKRWRAAPCCPSRARYEALFDRNRGARGATAAEALG